jgi:two-component system, NtrC family, response regulator AtoC
VVPGEVDAKVSEVDSPRLQLVVLAGEEARVLDLPAGGSLTIGRAEDAAVRIDDPSVSRNHAILHVGDRLTIEDLGSVNGTIVRDRASAQTAADTLNVRQLIARRAELAVGDTVLFGTASVMVRHAPAAEVADLARLVNDGPGFVVRDPAMRKVFEQALRAAPANINVLLLGETGVGKEVLARAIHARSTRAKGPFVGINCAALSDSLLESELFGHEKGAFTGAIQARPGLFEAAAGGTVFLDEVGELAPSTQAKLLRVLEERVVVRLGSTRSRPIDVRLLAATNRDLEAASHGGAFRSDLYFRINSLSLTIPPLRDRPGEIEPLAHLFLAAACRLIECQEIPTLSDAALQVLRRHRWPGNVRELRNAIERAVVLCPLGTILPEHLPPAMTAAQPAGLAGPTAAPGFGAAPDRPADLADEIRSVERARILETLAATGGNQSEAARRLGISRGTLIARIAQYGVPRPRIHDAESDG